MAGVKAPTCNALPTMRYWRKRSAARDLGDSHEVCDLDGGFEGYRLPPSLALPVLKHCTDRVCSTDCLRSIWRCGGPDLHGFQQLRHARQQIAFDCSPYDTERISRGSRDQWRGYQFAINGAFTRNAVQGNIGLRSVW
jgi:hypothetical protein